MIQLFKDKSLKNNTKTEQSACIGTGVRVSAEAGADNKNAKKQRGRSMVEMLGVLAIVGVLSIGGIQGYTMAMRKYRANEIVNVLTKYALAVYTSCQHSVEVGNGTNPASRGVEIGGSSDWGDSDDEHNSKSFWDCPVIPFMDAGLGPLPNGVVSIGSENYWRTSIPDGPYSSPDNEAGVSILSRQSGDIVVISFRVDDVKLCETILAITGGVQGHNEEDPYTRYFTQNSCYGSKDYAINKEVAYLRFSTVMN